MQYLTTEKAQGLCLTGWHLPMMAEVYDALRASVNNSRDALLETGQGPIATNTSGFSALFAGYRTYDARGFGRLGGSANFLSSTGYNNDYAYNMALVIYYSDVFLYKDFKAFGFSIRCLKDAL